MKTRYRMRNTSGVGFIILMADLLLCFVFFVLDMKPLNANGLMLILLIAFFASAIPGRLLFRFIRNLLTKKFEAQDPDDTSGYALDKADRITKMLDMVALLLSVALMYSIRHL